MRSTRRLLDRYSSVSTVALLSAAAAVAALNCGTEGEERRELFDRDASPEASTPIEDGAVTDRSSDAAPPVRPLPVECASPSCALELTTSHDESFCARLQDGTVACWGANDKGQLGRGDTSVGSATAARVVGLSNIVALDHTCAVDGDGAAFCWATGPFLQGDAGVTTELAPVKLGIPPAKKVSASPRTACAVVDDGVLCWGSNASAQVTPDASPDPALPPSVIALGPGAAILEVAVNEASFIVREDGTSESWGANALLARASSLSPDPYPAPTSFAQITALDVVEKRACAAVDGDALCWGGDIGAIPRRVSMPEPIVQISTTKTIVNTRSPYDVLKPSRWCAAAASGAVYCLGDNRSGQAGDGTKDHAYRPVRMVDLPGRAAQVKTTNDTTCVLVTSGDVYCVGNNYLGQLGDGFMRRPSLEPVKVILP
ncbi:MAG: hypothetical protein J0I07_28640 [Myxococcales bacterium]|nr:hypothetical protein [Myxococcales bacterium]